MKAHIEKFITKAKEKEHKTIQKERTILLNQLGINPRDITDEEFEEIKKYSYIYEETQYKGSESSLRSISGLILFLSILGGIGCFIGFADSSNDILGALGFAIPFYGFIQYYFIQVMTNISQKLINIEKILKEIKTK
jgi:hypothetical protein